MPNAPDDQAIWRPSHSPSTARPGSPRYPPSNPRTSRGVEPAWRGDPKQPPDSALLAAARTGNGVDHLKQALNRGANVEAKDPAGMTAIALAVMHGDADGVQLLLSRGANTSCPDLKQNQVLNLALERKDAVIADLLVRGGATVDLQSLELVRALVRSPALKFKFTPTLESILGRLNAFPAQILFGY